MPFSSIFFQKEMVLLQAAFFSMNWHFLTKSNNKKRHTMAGLCHHRRDIVLFGSDN